MRYTVPPAPLFSMRPFPLSPFEHSPSIPSTPSLASTERHLGKVGAGLKRRVMEQRGRLKTQETPAIDQILLHQEEGLTFEKHREMAALLEEAESVKETLRSPECFLQASGLMIAACHEAHRDASPHVTRVINILEEYTDHRFNDAVEQILNWSYVPPVLFDTINALMPERSSYVDDEAMAHLFFAQSSVGRSVPVEEIDRLEKALVVDLDRLERDLKDPPYIGTLQESIARRSIRLAYVARTQGQDYELIIGRTIGLMTASPHALRAERLALTKTLVEFGHVTAAETMIERTADINFRYRLLIEMASNPLVPLEVRKRSLERLIPCLEKLTQTDLLYAYARIAKLEVELGDTALSRSAYSSKNWQQILEQTPGSIQGTTDALITIQIRQAWGEHPFPLVESLKGLVRAQPQYIWELLSIAEWEPILGLSNLATLEEIGQLLSASKDQRTDIALLLAKFMAATAPVRVRSVLTGCRAAIEGFVGPLRLQEKDLIDYLEIVTTAASNIARSLKRSTV